MSHRARIWIAAAVTALFLAGVSAAGLALQDHPPRAQAAPSQPTASSVNRPAPAGDVDDHEESEHDE